MPHFGLMDVGKLGPVEGALLRARLHIRGGRRRLRQDKISAGIVTLYDALEFALEWYASDPERRIRGGLGDDPPKHSRDLYGALVRAGVLDRRLDFDAFDALTDKALEGELPGYDWKPLLDQIERVMARLGVMPFDEDALPAEDPSTF